MMRWTLVLGCVVFAACDNTEGIDDTDDTDVTVVDDPHSMTGGAKAECEDFDGTPIAGATTYFVGNFAFIGENDVGGWEYWALFTNQAWADTGQGWDCQIAWEIFGRKNSPVNCASCDYSIAFDAYVDETASDCVQGLVDIEGQDFSTAYDVRVDESSGAATIYFADSGNELGTGEADDQGLTYVTDARCSWF